jgi:hypothetical protein
MKHIRLFEGFNKDEYYQEIHEDTIPHLLKSSGGYTTFSKRDLNILCDDYGFNYTRWGDGSERIYKQSKKMGRKNSFTIYIYQLPDEYFILNVYYGGYPIEKSFYKCDQVDGVIKLLEDKGWA